MKSWAEFRNWHRRRSDGMKLFWRYGLFLTLVVFVVFLSPLWAAKNLSPEGTPTRAIQDLDKLLDQYVIGPRTSQEVQFNAELKKKVLYGTFDIRRLCRLALADHWQDIASADQEKFVSLMTQLLEKKAIFSKEQGGGKGTKANYFVVYKGDKYLSEDKNQAMVMSYVNIPSEALKIGLNYKMIKEAEGSWRIYDVIVDDASLLDNYRYQFDAIIRKDGFPDLMRRMEVKLKDLIKDHERRVGTSP